MAKHKFPDDGREWFRCLTDILDDPKLSACSGDEAFAYLRLLAMLKRVGSEDGTVELDRRGICFVTRRYRVVHAESILSRLQAHSLSTCSRLRVGYLLTVPKWAEIQGIGNASRVEKSRVEKIEPSPLSADDPTPKKSSRKRKNPCPENLDVEQWTRIHTWRDEKHPDFTDRELKAQWELHYQHHGAKGNLRADWVLSFYNWLTGPYYKPATASGEPERRVPDYEPRDGPLLSETAEDADRLAREFAEHRLADMPRPKLGH